MVALHRRMTVATVSLGDRVRAFAASLILLLLSLVWFTCERFVTAVTAHSFPELDVASEALAKASPAPASRRRWRANSSSSSSSSGRPRTMSTKKFTLVLDLDETLVHTSTIKTSHYDLRVDVFGKKPPNVFYVLKRPYVDVFLERIAQHFSIVVYTASIRSYAETVIDMIDPNHYIGKRYFRDSCIARNGTFMKDLTFVSDDLSKTIIVDNAPESYALHEDNVIPIEAWYDDPSDEELLNLIPFLMVLRCTLDVRSVLCRRLKNTARSLASRRA